MVCDNNSSASCPDHRCTLSGLGWTDWVILLVMVCLMLCLVLLFKLFIFPLFRGEEASYQPTTSDGVNLTEDTVHL